MAHSEQFEFVATIRRLLPHYFRNSRVLEVGSWDANGSVRPLFENCDYTGVDIAAGPGVDIVCPGQTLNHPAASYDVVISCECFEHNPCWHETLLNMVRMLKPGGLCIVSCASMGRSEQGTRRMGTTASLTAGTGQDSEYYRNLQERDFTRRFHPGEFFDTSFFHENIYRKDLYFVGHRRDGAPLNGEVVAELRARIRRIRKHGASPWLLPLLALKYVFKLLATHLIGENRVHDLEYGLKRLQRSRPRGLVNGDDRNGKVPVVLDEAIAKSPDASTV